MRWERRVLPLYALALLLSVPWSPTGTSLALAALPGGTHEGEREVRYLLRVHEGALVRVEADAGVVVALVPPGAVPDEAAFVAAPAELRAPEGEWHGLPDVVELVARRADPAQAVLLQASEGGSGVAFEWQAAMRAPVPPREAPLPAWLVVAALAVAAPGALVVAQAGRRSWRMRRSLRPSLRSVICRLPRWLLTMRTLPLKRSVICSGLWPKR